MITKENLLEEAKALRDRLSLEGRDNKGVTKSVESLIMVTISDDDFCFTREDLALGNEIMQEVMCKSLSAFLIAAFTENQL